jgi:hypothetical protein
MNQGRSGVLDFKIDIEHRVGGRKVSEWEWARHLENQVQDVGRESITSKVCGMRCPVHGEGVTVTAAPGGVNIRTCCDEHLHSVQQAL